MVSRDLFIEIFYGKYFHALLYTSSLSNLSISIPYSGSFSTDLAFSTRFYFENALNYKSDHFSFFYSIVGFFFDETSVISVARARALAHVAWLKRVINYGLASTWMNAMPSIATNTVDRGRTRGWLFYFRENFASVRRWNMHRTHSRASESRKAPLDIGEICGVWALCI